jgi:hypothetical protein
VVLASVLSSIAFLAIARSVVPQEPLRQGAEAIGGYLQVLGTVYAVLLAFVVFVVWSQFNECRGYVESEANELVDLHRTVSGFPRAVSVPVRQLLRRYVALVLEEEWPNMQKTRVLHDDRGARILDELWSALRRYDTGCEREESLYGEVLTRFNDLSDLRTNRWMAARVRIPFALRVLIYVGAAFTLGSMSLLSVEPFALHALIVSVLAGAISHIIYIIEDLDHCFSGDWQIPREPFERAQRCMRDQAKKKKAA